MTEGRRECPVCKRFGYPGQTMEFKRPPGGARGQTVSIWDSGACQCRECGLLAPVGVVSDIAAVFSEEARLKNLGMEIAHAAQNGLEQCDICGSNKIHIGPPDCPGCGAPNCCQTCCERAAIEPRIDELEAEMRWIIEDAVAGGNRQSVRECCGWFGTIADRARRILDISTPGGPLAPTANPTEET